MPSGGSARDAAVRSGACLRARGRAELLLVACVALGRVPRGRLAAEPARACRASARRRRGSRSSTRPPTRSGSTGTAPGRRARRAFRLGRRRHRHDHEHHAAHRRRDRQAVLRPDVEHGAEGRALDARRLPGRTQLNPTDRPVSIPIDGSVTLDLYAADSGYFKAASASGSTLDLAGGGTARPSLRRRRRARAAVEAVEAAARRRPRRRRPAARRPAAPPTATTTGAVTVNGAPFTTGTIPFNATVDVTRGADRARRATWHADRDRRGRHHGRVQARCAAPTAASRSSSCGSSKGDFSACPKQAARLRGRDGDDRAPGLGRRQGPASARAAATRRPPSAARGG